MGTFITQTIYGKNAQIAADNGTLEIQRLENIFSANIETSELSKINASAENGATINVSPDFMNVLKKAKMVYDKSGGALDVTIGNPVSLWGIGTPNANVPKEIDIKNSLTHIGFDKLEIDEENSRIKILDPKCRLDFGAIAKGYAADRVIEIYKSMGIQDAVLSVGGNAYAIGKNPSNKPFKIGIRNPDKDENSIIGYINASNLSVVTSGDYERFFMQDGVLYHHILDPKTGYPKNSGLRSVTITGTDSTTCDALSTAVFVLGKQKGQTLLSNFPDYGCVFIEENKHISITDNLTDLFVFQDESGEFSYDEKG